MKKIIILLSFLLSYNVFSADKARHTQMSLKINEYSIAAQSEHPNKAFVYFSSKDNVDRIDYQIVTTDGDNLSDGQVKITRPTSTKNGDVIIDSNLVECQADYGEVTIQPSALIVYTDRLPVRVLCKNASGSYREFYQTIYEP